MSTHVKHCRSKIPQGICSAFGVGRLSHTRALHAGNAYITYDANDALHSIDTKFRLAVKDNIATKSLPTTCASNILAGQEIPFTATIVQQLQRHGLTVTGKTNMDEFGMGTHSTASARGPVSNVPRLEGRSAGGSSGGSAVAVSTGTTNLALGTDTGGSVRMPAAYTNTVGFKPSYGMISRWGVVPYANSLDTVGFIARTVDEIQSVIHAVSYEHDPRDPTSLSKATRERCKAQGRRIPQGLPSYMGEWLKGLTFGIPIEYNIEELDPRIKQGWMQAAEKIQKLGGRVVPVSLPSTKNALSAYYVIAPAEAASNLSKYDGIRYGKRAEGATSDALDGVLYAQTRGTGFGPEVKRRILLGSYTLSSKAVDNYFIQAQKVRQLVRKDFDRIFKLPNPLCDEAPFDLSEMDESIGLENKLGPVQVDFIVCPTAPTPPPKLDDVAKQTPLDSYMNDVFTVPASLAGLPAISIPMDIPAGTNHGVSGEADLNFGGLQIIGQYWDDAMLLAVSKGISREISSEAAKY